MEEEFHELGYINDSLNCDASFSWKKKVMEWRVLDTIDGEELLRTRMEGGTSNVAEWMAIVESMMYLDLNGGNIPIYSDSTIAIGWVNRRKCHTQALDLPKEVEDLISEYEDYLEENAHRYEVLKWNTRKWGEILSDFGRKNSIAKPAIKIKN